MQSFDVARLRSLLNFDVARLRSLFDVARLSSLDVTRLRGLLLPAGLGVLVLSVLHARRQGLPAAREAKAPSPQARTRRALEEAVAAFLATSSVTELAASIRELRDGGEALGQLFRVEDLFQDTPTGEPTSPGAVSVRHYQHPTHGQASAATASRVWVTAELVKTCAYAACERGEEAGERLCSALVQLTLLGVVSPRGLEHGLRVMAARLSDVMLDHRAALAHLTGFAGWLAQSEVVAEACFEQGALPPAAWEAALQDSCVLDPASASAGLSSLASSLTSRLRSRAPTQLSQLREMYKEAVEAYLASGGGALEATLHTLNDMRARWTLHELVRKLCHAFLDATLSSSEAAGPGAAAGAATSEAAAAAAAAPPLYTTSSGGTNQGPLTPVATTPATPAPPMPPWLVRELLADLLCTLVQRGVLDAASIAAGAEATLRELPDYTLDVPSAPLLLGSLLARLCAEGALPTAYITGKHSCLEGATLAAAVAAAEEEMHGGWGGGSAGGGSGSGSEGPNPSPLGATPTLIPAASAASAASGAAAVAAAATAVQAQQAAAPAPAVMATPALGPLPRNNWAGTLSAKRQSSYGASAGGGASGAQAQPASAAEDSSSTGGAAAAAADAAAWTSQSPGEEELEDTFDLGAPAVAASSGMGSSSSSSSGAGAPPSPLLSLRASTSPAAAALTPTTSGTPPAPALSRTLSARRRAALTGSSTPTATPTPSAADFQPILQALTLANTLLGAAGSSGSGSGSGSGLAAEATSLVARMRSLDIWGTRCLAIRGEGKHFTVGELRARCHEMAHDFALSALHEVHSPEFPVLRSGSGSGSTSSPVLQQPTQESAEFLFITRLHSFGQHWGAAMGGNAVFYVAEALVRTAGAVATSAAGGGGGEAEGEGTAPPPGAASPPPLPPHLAPGAAQAVEELSERTLSLLTMLVNTGALPAEAVRLGLARVLEECYLSSEPALEAGAVEVLGQLLARLSRSGALGRTPFFPWALRPQVMAQVEEEGGEDNVIAQVRKQVEGQL